MDFKFAPEQEAFRASVREFLKENLPPEFACIDEMEVPGRFEFTKGFAKKLASRGWLAPSWPKEYGGGGLSLWEQLILKFELTYAGAPDFCPAATGFVGPTIIMYGTEAQKKQHLNGIANADVFWCQGYSEPNAGSDLASLTTRAVLDGDEFVINGQKIWTSHGHQAQWMIVLARTDPDAPKHRGISYFLVPMDTPGIALSPLTSLANTHIFNETFLEDVRVPKSALLGELNRGWYMAAATLDFERASVMRWVALGQNLMEQLLGYLGSAPEGREVLKDHPALRHEIAQLAIDIEAARYLSYRVVSMQSAGLVPNYEASISKAFNSEMTCRMANLGVKALGLYGQLRESSICKKIDGIFPLMYMCATGYTVAAGTSEIQRNIIAQRGLGLPRG